MNTKPFQWMAVPFFNKTKLTREQQELQKRIDLETKDLKRIFYSRWTVFKSSFRKAKLFSFYESTLTQANNHLSSIKDIFEYNVTTIDVYRAKLWDFVLPSSQSELMKLNQQRKVQNQWVKNKAQAIENHTIVIEGTKAETDINNAYVIALESDSRLKKAQHANKAIDNLGVEIELQNKYKADLLNKASHQPESILSDPNRLKYETTLPSYPEVKNEQYKLDSFENSYQPKASDSELTQNEKPVFTGKDKSSVTHHVDFSMVDGPEYYLAESQFLKSQQAYGMYFAKTNFPDVATEQTLELSTTSSKALDVPNLEETFLGSITLSKVNLTFLVVFLAMIPEYLIYSAIISAIFEFSGIKAWLAGSVVLLFGKANAMIIYGSVLEYFKKQSKVFEFKNVKINRFFFFLFCVSLLYCFAIGLLFKTYKDEQKATKDYVMLEQKATQMEQEAELSAENHSAQFDRELQRAKQEAEKAKLKMTTQSDSPSLLKVVTIGFSGAIVLLFSSCLFAMALIFSSCYHLRRKVEIAIKKIINSETRFDAQKQAISVFRSKAFHICSLIGELEFLRRLSEGTPRESLYREGIDDKTSKDSSLPLPLVSEKDNSTT